MIPLHEVKSKLSGETPAPLAKFLWENMREGWAFVAADGTMEIVNPAFAEMLGWSVPELRGRKFQEITIGSDIGPDEEQLDRLIKGEIKHYTMVKSYRTKMGGVITAKLRVNAFEAGRIVCGTILPIDTLSLEHLPPEEERRVLAMLVGRWAIDHWKLMLTIFGVLGGVMRLDDILELLK